MSKAVPSASALYAARVCFISWLPITCRGWNALHNSVLSSNSMPLAYKMLYIARDSFGVLARLNMCVLVWEPMYQSFR